MFASRGWSCSSPEDLAAAFPQIHIPDGQYTTGLSFFVFPIEETASGWPKFEDPARLYDEEQYEAMRSTSMIWRDPGEAASDLVPCTGSYVERDLKKHEFAPVKFSRLAQCDHFAVLPQLRATATGFPLTCEKLCLVINEMPFRKHSKSPQTLRRTVETSPLDNQELTHVFVQLALAIFHIQFEADLVHGNVHVESVFYDTATHLVQLGPFSTHRIPDDSRRYCGPIHLTPEEVLGMNMIRSLMPTVDVFDLGELIFFCATKKHPFRINRGLRDYVASVRECVIVEGEEFRKTELGGVVEMMLRKSMHERPSIAEVLQLPAVQGMVREFVSWVHMKESIPQRVKEGVERSVKTSTAMLQSMAPSALRWITPVAERTDGIDGKPLYEGMVRRYAPPSKRDTLEWSDRYMTLTTEAVVLTLWEGHDRNVTFKIEQLVYVFPVLPEDVPGGEPVDPDCVFALVSHQSSKEQWKFFLAPSPQMRDAWVRNILRASANASAERIRSKP